MSRTTVPPRDQHDLARAGLAFGLLAYFLWGVLPIYFKQIAAISAVDIVAHRIVWSLLFLGLLLAATRGWGQVRSALKHGRTLGLLFATSLLIAINWLLYV